jgi:hypothetical protein
VCDYDKSSLYSDLHASGDDDAEFDFRVFRWHRLEHSGRIPNAAKNPWAAEAILDVDAKPISRAPSRRSSPRPPQLDAFAVSTEHRPRVSVSTAEDLLNETLIDSQYNGTDTLSYTDGTWSFEDNFIRFMEQAGYATMNQGETLPWALS